jgi:hypothetical protein
LIVFQLAADQQGYGSRGDIINIMQAYVMLHNMVVEDEKKLVRVSIDLNKNASVMIVLPPEVHTSDSTNA